MTEKLKEYAEGLPERRDLPKWYVELKEELQKHADRIEERLHRFFFKALVALAVVGVASAIGLLGFGIVLKKQAQFSKEIQRQRFEVQLENCLNQNIRHDRTLAKAENFLPKQGLATVELLVDELAPFTEDCVKYATARVKGTKDGDN